MGFLWLLSIAGVSISQALGVGSLLGLLLFLDKLEETPIYYNYSQIKQNSFNISISLPSINVVNILDQSTENNLTLESVESTLLPQTNIKYIEAKEQPIDIWNTNQQKVCAK
jgi:hypothetical protein